LGLQLHVTLFLAISYNYEK